MDLKTLGNCWHSFWNVLNECNNRHMHDRITNVIAFAKHKKRIQQKELICRYIKMKYNMTITPSEIGCRVAFLKEVCIYESL
jgi:hypothetical protein